MYYRDPADLNASDLKNITLQNEKSSSIFTLCSADWANALFGSGRNARASGYSASYVKWIGRPRTRSDSSHGVDSLARSQIGSLRLRFGGMLGHATCWRTNSLIQSASYPRSASSIVCGSKAVLRPGLPSAPPPRPSKPSAAPTTRRCCGGPMGFDRAAENERPSDRGRPSCKRETRAFPAAAITQIRGWP